MTTAPASLGTSAAIPSTIALTARSLLVSTGTVQRSSGTWLLSLLPRNRNWTEDGRRGRLWGDLRAVFIWFKALSALDCHPWGLRCVANALATPSEDTVTEVLSADHRVAHGSHQSFHCATLDHVSPVLAGGPTCWAASAIGARRFSQTPLLQDRRDSFGLAVSARNAEAVAGERENLFGLRIFETEACADLGPICPPDGLRTFCDAGRFTP